MIMSFENITHEQVHSYVLESIAQATERLYPYTNYLAYLLARKKNQELKNLVSFPSSTVSTSAHEALYHSLPQEDIDFSQLYYQNTVSEFNSDDLIYLYYGSSNNLFTNVFQNILPSDFAVIYKYLVDNKLVKKIGTNTGKAHLISSQIAFHDFSTFTTKLSFDNYPDAFDSMMKDLSTLKMDRQYLLALLKDKDQTISDLHSTIDQINHNNYIASTYTWS